MEIDALKAFGYNISKVTGWKNGEYRYYLECSKLGVSHDNYSVFKTPEQAWKAAANHYKRTFTPDFLLLLKEKDKLKTEYYKAEKKIDKQLKVLGKSISYGYHPRRRVA